MPSLVYAISLLLLVPGLCTASTTLLHESKTELFLSAPSFAVVGASDDERKFGTIVFKTMLDQGLDVVPINPFVPESQGIPCLHALSDLADPARTAISVVTPPAVTLEIVRQAHALGVYAVWLQPGAEDAAVLAFIANATANSPTRTSYIHSTAQGLARRSSSPCAIADPDAPDVISTIALRR
ncbi:succinyl CoA synthetase-like protein [Mycena maculata]|uniref:Succinyl CoA synthetase-like protein n=1 Tax=Mycena maculata TaxID=230809 RepID=A0AAD7JEG6_9AGAR|nr:succinyl CoA synthetase-like protein [Mycena maculata]